MDRAKAIALTACALAAAGAATFHLAAQPEPYRPISTTDAAYDLTLPPGTYQSLVVAYEGGTNSKPLKVTLKAPSGDLTLLVPAGETVVVPLNTGGGWTLTQAVTVKLTQPAAQVHVSALSPAGPIRLEAAKK